MHGEYGWVRYLFLRRAVTVDTGRTTKGTSCISGVFSVHKTDGCIGIEGAEEEGCRGRAEAGLGREDWWDGGDGLYSTVRVPKARAVGFIQRAHAHARRKARSEDVAFF